MSYKIKPTDMAGCAENGFQYRKWYMYESQAYWSIHNSIIKIKVINSKLIQEMYK